MQPYYYDFYENFRVFENMIAENPDNKELVNVYIKLIEVHPKRDEFYSKFYIEQLKSDTEYNKELVNNQYDYKTTLANIV